MDNREEGYREKNNYELIKQDIEFVMYRSNENDAYSQYILGEYYYNGIKVNKDINKAIERFNMAIINGSIDAITSLGVYYYDIFYNRAISGYYRYSNQGDPISKQRLGTMYYNGKGIKKRY